ncbi:hypothetical protein B9479_007803 [Cryptococcus floricola]|uniref:Uncharacterized protein n=1 Tax=Cryptococcus floricola TaxID=2591691 RepID=A0A5D3AJ82_9TREE|nr:hypothetical protein B9479_007803 [Cryptococcus floricola]
MREEWTDMVSLKDITRVTLSQVDAIQAYLRQNPSSHPNAPIMITPKFRRTIYVILGRLEPLGDSSKSASEARPLIKGVAEKKGHLSEDDEGRLCHTAGRLEAAAQLMAERERIPLFTVSAVELRTLT